MTPRRDRLLGRYAVAPRSEWKRAMLLFDKVYAPSEVVVFLPDSVRPLTFSSPSLSDVEIPMIPDHLRQRIDTRMAMEVFGVGGHTDTSLVPQWAERRAIIMLCRRVAATCRSRNIDAVEIYGSDDTFAAAYPGTNEIAYQAALDGLPVIDEASVSWEQIVAFREDEQALRRYRDLRLWLATGLTAKSVDEATDLIEQKIEDYEWALKKHGLATVTGAFSQVMDSKWFAAVIGGAGIATLMAGPVWAGLSAGAVVVSGAATWLAERAIEREDVARGQGREVAILHEARRKFG